MEVVVLRTLPAPRQLPAASLHHRYSLPLATALWEGRGRIAVRLGVFGHCQQLDQGIAVQRLVGTVPMGPGLHQQGVLPVGVFVFGGVLGWRVVWMLHGDGGGPRKWGQATTGLCYHGGTGDGWGVG